MYKKFEIIHFVGIGGSGMSGIAEVLKNIGYEVKGSDLKESETTKRLRSMGIGIEIGHREKNIKDSHVVVVSSAVHDDNREVVAARERGIPVIPRAEMLAELARLKYGILIAGAHGKTTTTSLIASVLASVELDPTVIIGGKLKDIGSHAKYGEGDFLVAEADESDGSFLKLTPTIAIVTNIDREHMDFFKTIDRLKEAFLSFVNKVPFYGLSILCADNEHVRSFLPEVRRRFITYGLSEGLDLIARNVTVEGFKSKFEAVFRGRSLGCFEVPLPGVHNVSNCLAAIGVAHELELDINRIREELLTFSGIQRRFEFKGEVSGIKVFDDYGHHPTEIKVTLQTARESMVQSATIEKQERCRLFVLFQPHRYSRTRDLFTDFCRALVDSDRVILLDIYSAGEEPLEGINAHILYEGMVKNGVDAVHISNKDEIVDCLLKELRDGDVLLTLGAGDVWEIGEEFLKVKRTKTMQEGKLS
jgi:UDP-N-acetylmuramate--alanine ligase